MQQAGDVPNHVKHDFLHLFFSNRINALRDSGGDERIRTSDQSFSPDAPLAGECLRPARPRLRTSYYYNALQFNG